MTCDGCQPLKYADANLVASGNLWKGFEDLSGAALAKQTVESKFSQDRCFSGDESVESIVKLKKEQVVNKERNPSLDLF